MLATLILKKHEDRRINNGHLWVYSNEVNVDKTPFKNFIPGELVRINDSQQKPIAIGYVNPHSLICARVLTFDINESIEHAFFVNRIRQALSWREQIFSKPYYRLIYGESDFLPGVIVDRYADIIVLQITTMGMEQLQNNIIDALDEVLQPNVIILKNDSSTRKLEGLEDYVTVVKGQLTQNILIEENGTPFYVNSLKGQKTGWFYDHRLNRARSSLYANNRNVLDVFSYVGGWGIQAGRAGAKHITCVDSSKSACEYLLENAKHNQIQHKVNVIHADAFDALSALCQEEKCFDQIILDPPAFIKSKKDIPQGKQAYQRINQRALQLINSDGILISASCSMHLTMPDLWEAINKANLKTKRKLVIVEQGHQGPDHPIHPLIPETAYLKMLIVRVI